MTANWWNTQTAAPKEAPAPLEPLFIDSPLTSAEPAPSPVEPPKVNPGQDDQEAARRAHGMAVKVVGGAAGALIVGLFALNALSDGGGEKAEQPVAASAGQSDELPPAGGGAPQGDLLPAGGGPAQAPQDNAKSDQDPRAEQVPREVTLTASPAGRGRVGSVMEISIRNNTGKPLTVMATLVRGDGRSGVVGEGTLAPGSRVVEPGQTAQGTVEFSSSTTPHQVALVDLSGNVVAASN